MRADRPGAVLFDLDDTLYDHTRASRQALAETAAAYRDLAELDAETLFREFTRHNDECWALAGCGQMTRE